MSEQGTEDRDAGAVAAGPIERLTRELRQHAFGYAILFTFTLAGPAVVYFLFPDAPILVGLIGGLVFGAYAALCAVPDKFF